ncbi:MAG: DUF1127 domain-containing protein [Geminicoccaceae bacterium]
MIGEVGQHLPASSGSEVRRYRPIMEHGAMVFIHRIVEYLAEMRGAAAIRHELRRLTPRALADLGMTPEDVSHVARAGARLGPKGATMAQIVGEARASGLSRPSLNSRITHLVRSVEGAIERTDFGRRLNLEFVWRCAYGRVRAELATYSDRELMADLRLNRSDIDRVAAEGADEQVARFVTAHPAYRRAGHGRTSLGRIVG